jgi:hypothetical protein
MAGSILVAVRKGIIAGLTADVKPALDVGGHDVNIAYQWKLDDSVREWVYTNKGVASRTPAGLRAGRNFRDEVGRFVLTALVAGPDFSAEEAAERCMVIASAVETWVSDRKNNELGITGLQTLTVDGDLLLDEMFLDTGHLAIAEIPIKFTARLT